MDPLCDIRLTFENELDEDHHAFSTVLRDAQIKLLEKCDYFKPIVSAESKWAQPQTSCRHLTWPHYLVSSILKINGREYYTESEVLQAITTIFAPKQSLQPVPLHSWMFLFISNSFLGSRKIIEDLSAAQTAFEIEYVFNMFNAWITACIYTGVEMQSVLCGDMLNKAQEFADSLYRARDEDASYLAQKIAETCANFSNEFLGDELDDGTSSYIRTFILVLLAPQRNLRGRSFSNRPALEDTPNLLSHITEWPQNDDITVAKSPRFHPYQTQKLTLMIAGLVHECSFNGNGEPYEVFVAGGAVLAGALNMANQYAERLRPSDVDVFICGNVMKTIRVFMAMIQKIFAVYPDSSLNFNRCMATIDLDPYFSTPSKVQIILSSAPCMASAILLFDRTHIQWAYNDRGYWCSPEYLLCHRQRLAIYVNHSPSVETAIRRFHKMELKGYRHIHYPFYWKNPLFGLLPYSSVLPEDIDDLEDDCGHFKHLRDQPLNIWKDVSDDELVFEVEPCSCENAVNIEDMDHTSTEGLEIASLQIKQEICIDAPLQAYPTFEQLENHSLFIITDMKSDYSFARLDMKSLADPTMTTTITIRGNCLVSDDCMFFYKPGFRKILDDDYPFRVYWYVDYEKERIINPDKPPRNEKSNFVVGDIVSYIKVGSESGTLVLVKHTGDELEHMKRVMTPVEKTWKRKLSEHADDSQLRKMHCISASSSSLNS